MSKKEILKATEGGLGIFDFFLLEWTPTEYGDFTSPNYYSLDDRSELVVFEDDEGIWRFEDCMLPHRFNGDCIEFIAMVYGLDLLWNRDLCFAIAEFVILSTEYLYNLPHLNHLDGFAHHIRAVDELFR
jgi:hypothetical protein